MVECLSLSKKESLKDNGRYVNDLAMFVIITCTTFQDSVSRISVEVYVSCKSDAHVACTLLYCLIYHTTIYSPTILR